MKIAFPWFMPVALALAFLLTSCGGGGDTDNRPVKPAVATVEFPSDGARAPLATDTVPVLLALLSAAIDQTKSLGLPTMPFLYINDVYEETIAGPQGGSVDVTAISTASGSGDWQYVVFNGYTEDGVEVNGAVLEESTGEADSNTGFKHPYRISFYDYTITMPGSMLALTGTIESRALSASNTHTLVANVAIRDAFSERALYLRDFAVRDVTDSPDSAIAVDGVILEADMNGDVLTYDVSTLPEGDLRYVLVEEERMPSRGSLKLAGNGAEAMDIDFLNSHLVYAFVHGGSTPGGYRISVAEDELADDALSELDHPVAAARESVAVDNGIGTVRTLDGRFSAGPASVPLEYSWELIYRPFNSAAELQDAAAAVAHVTPDVPGDYLFRLTVSDGVNEADDLLAISVADADRIHDMSEAFEPRAQILPAPAAPGHWIVDMRTAIHPVNSVASLSWGYELLGAWDAWFEVIGQTSATIDLTEAQGMFISDACCNGLFPVREMFDRPDAAPRLHQPFAVMDLQMENISSTATLLHGELADIDNDGFKDLLATPAVLGFSVGYPDENMPGIYIRHGLADGFGETEWFDIGNASRFAVGDVDGDGDMDIVAGDEDCTVDVALGNEGGFSPAVNIALTGTCEPFSENRRHARRFVISDLDNDGQPTIITSTPNEIDIDLIDLDAAGNIVAQRDVPLGTAMGDTRSLIDHIAVVDLNLDGRRDIAVSLGGGTSGTLGRPLFLIQNADGTFSVDERAVKMGEYHVPRLSVGDFDGDGHDDLATGLNYTVRVWKSAIGGPVIIYEDNLYTMEGSHHLGANWVSFADINGDDDDELLLQGSTDKWILVVDRETVPEEATNTSWMTLPDSVMHSMEGSSLIAAPVIEDRDGDGMLDFVLFHDAAVFVAFGRND